MDVLMKQEGISYSFDCDVLKQMIKGSASRDISVLIAIFIFTEAVKYLLYNDRDLPMVNF
jgi:hypothetical protein